MNYLEKVERIRSRDREIVRERLTEIAESIRRKYPELGLTYEDLNRWIREQLNLSV